MKNSIIKVLALGCAVAMIAAAAGCGSRVVEEEVWLSGEDSTTTVVHSSGSSDTASGSVNDEGRTDVEGITDNGSKGNFDLKGATVVVGYYRSGDGGAPATSSPTYQDEIKLISDIEKKYKCKIEYKNVGDSMSYYRAWTAAAQAGTKFADIFQIATSVVFPTHMKAGYLTKLDSYLDMNSVIYNKKAMEQTAVGGSHYITVMSNRLYAASGIYFNKKVFSAFNQKTPDTYVKSNNWNWNTFLEVAKATTGTKNGVQYYGYGYKGMDVAYWAVSNGGKKVVNEGGKYKFNMGSPQFLKGVQFVYDLYNTNHVTAPISSDVGNLWTSGSIAMYIALPDKGAQYMDALGSSNVGFTYIPKGPDVKDYNVTVEETTAFGIPSTVKNPDVMSQIMYDLTYPYKWRATVEQQQEKNFGDAVSMQTAMDIAVRGNDNIDLMPLYDYIRTICLSDFGISAQTSPQGYVASVAAAAQAEIDSIWGQ